MRLFGQKKKLVLVADDSFTDRKTTCAFLKENGYDVIEAQDGGPAVVLAVKEKPDLILMGNNMLLLSGQTAVAILRSHPKTWYIPIIMVSYNDRIANVERCLAEGANDYVMKPFQAERLLGKIQTLLKPSPRSPAGPPKP